MTPAAVRDRVRGGGLLGGPGGGRVVVLLSGGRDSVCLLDVAVAVAGRAAVRALHCNYGLRGEESDADEAFCRELCARLKIALTVVRAGPPAGNVQAWARDVRYAEALRLVEGDVAAGHTASDQVETVLYRLAASPGRRALLGMRPREGRLVRPLLGAWREETEAWCAEHGLPWREDPSNATRAFARNRVRLDVVPALRELHPAAEANVLRTLELLRDEAAVLDAAVDAVLREAGDPPAVERLRALPPALARLVVLRLAGGEAVGHRTEEILALPEHGALDVGGGLRARIEGGRLTFGPTPPRVRS